MPLVMPWHHFQSGEVLQFFSLCQMKQSEEVSALPFSNKLSCDSIYRVKLVLQLSPASPLPTLRVNVAAAAGRIMRQCIPGILCAPSLSPSLPLRPIHSTLLCANLFWRESGREGRRRFNSTRGGARKSCPPPQVLHFKRDSLLLPSDDGA